MQTVRFDKQREFQKGTSIQFPKAVNRKTTCGLSPEHTQEPIAKKKIARFAGGIHVSKFSPGVPK